MPREQTRGSGVLENALLLRCRDHTRAPRADTERWSAIKTRDELLFALELLFELLIMELPSATQKPDKDHALLFALERD